MVQVTVDPLSRIEGHYRVNTEVNEEGVITDAQSNGLQLRGFERLLQKHDPRDAALLIQEDLWGLPGLPQHSCSKCSG